MCSHSVQPNPVHGPISFWCRPLLNGTEFPNFVPRRWSTGNTKSNWVQPTNSGSATRRCKPVNLAYMLEIMRIAPKTYWWRVFISLTTTWWLRTYYYLPTYLPTYLTYSACVVFEQLYRASRKAANCLEGWRMKDEGWRIGDEGWGVSVVMMPFSILLRPNHRAPNKEAKRGEARCH